MSIRYEIRKVIKTASEKAHTVLACHSNEGKARKQFDEETRLSEDHGGRQLQLVCIQVLKSATIKRKKPK